MLTLEVLSICQLGAAKDQHMPLPARILNAKTVYIENRSGSAAIGDSAYQELANWARFRVVNDRAQADIVFVLSGHREVVGAEKNGGPDVRFFSGLQVTDANTGESLWADSRQAALLRKSAIKRAIDELRKRIEEQERPAPKAKH
jgi:hypothetical protein